MTYRHNFDWWKDKKCLRKAAVSRSVADPENFGGGGFEAQNLKNSDVFTKIESDFSAEIGNSNIFSPKIRWSPKKKKRSSPKLRLIFWPDSLRLGRWDGDASRNGAKLFEIEADFLAKIVTFRLVGGDASPPLNPPLIEMCRCKKCTGNSNSIKLKQ